MSAEDELVDYEEVETHEEVKADVKETKKYAMILLMSHPGSFLSPLPGTTP